MCQGVPESYPADINEREITEIESNKHSSLHTIITIKVINTQRKVNRALAISWKTLMGINAEIWFAIEEEKQVRYEQRSPH